MNSISTIPAKFKTASMDTIPKNPTRKVPESPPPKFRWSPTLVPWIRKKGFAARVLSQIAATSTIVYIFYRPRQWTPTSLPSNFGHFAGILDIWWSQRRSGMLQFVNRLIDMSNKDLKGQLFETKQKVVLRSFLVVFQNMSIKKMIKQGPNDWPETTWCSRESL